MKVENTTVLTDAFSAPESGFDYFATPEHYEQLARAILDALCRGRLVLVTGDAGPDLQMVAEALRTAAAPRQVTEVPCSPELDHKEQFRHTSPDQEPALDVAPAARTRNAAPGSPIYLFDDADRLSEAQVKDLLEMAQGDPAEVTRLQAGVFLASRAFLDRFKSSPDILKDGFAAHLGVQHLERDEVEVFIRRQLPAERVSLFTAQRIALMALTSGGDPAAVNRIARRMLESELGASEDTRAARRSRPPEPFAKKSDAVEQRSAAAHTASSGESEQSPGSRFERPRHGSVLRLAAIAIGMAALWLIIGAVGSQRLDSVIAVIRHHLSLENNGNAAQAEPPARAATALPSLTTPVSPYQVTTNAASSDPTTAVDRGADIGAPGRPAADAAPISSAVQPPVSESSALPLPAPPTPPASQVSVAEIAALTARGDAFLKAGDIASARAFFERAANAGDRSAAIRMAVTFDRAFLDRARMHSLRG
ncbi:MAG: hypothetical protein JO139_08745, partial [Alphaproteobacteria bacterium]|nr:hypothetical protein [Alphaproteobacteria bacterium]